MTRISDRQRQIIDFIRDHENDSVKLIEIVEKFKHWYYHNGRHHISEIMYRMVKSQKLTKPKRGYYAISVVSPIGVNTAEPVDPAQISIFDQVYMHDCMIQESCMSFKTLKCNKDCKLYM
jgi:hypothetical protein